MKKTISVLLVFAVVASLMSVCGFATDAETVSSVNGVLDKMASAFADFVTPLMDEYNCSSNDIIFDTGLNDFLGRVEAFMESVCVAVIELVATIEGLF